MVVGDPGEDARGADAAPVHESKLSQHDVQCHHLSVPPDTTPTIMKGLRGPARASRGPPLSPWATLQRLSIQNLVMTLYLATVFSHLTPSTQVRTFTENKHFLNLLILGILLISPDLTTEVYPHVLVISVPALLVAHQLHAELLLQGGAHDVDELVFVSQRFAPAHHLALRHQGRGVAWLPQLPCQSPARMKYIEINTQNKFKNL